MSQFVEQHFPDWNLSDEPIEPPAHQQLGTREAGTNSIVRRSEVVPPTDYGFSDEGISIAVDVSGSMERKTVTFHDGTGDVVAGQDIVVIFLSHERMMKCSRQAGIKHFAGIHLNREVEIDDEILCDLAMCLDINSKRPDGGNNHFAEQIVQAICAHVIQTYGHTSKQSSRVYNQLAPWQVKIAKRMLRGDMQSTPNLAEVADACRISTRHFTRSFTQTIGTSPHQWSVLARLEHAKKMLEDRTATLAETAVSCGFSDQSHFTRVFTREFGTSPARWRRSLAPN